MVVPKRDILLALKRLIMKRKYVALLGISVLLICLNTILPAFGDGFTMENLPPATLGDRKAGLFIQVNPPILTVESVKNAFVYLRFYDANTNQTIKHVSYFIKIEKSGKLLMQDLFHTHTGELNLKIVPQQGPVKIQGDKEPILGGWIESGGPIVVESPVFLEGGLYHFTMEIFGVDFDNNIFKPEDAPRFDSWLSVGDITSNIVTYKDKSYPIEVISYYDKISGFTFDAENGDIKYSMPFDWDTSRLENNPVFVHQEIKVPSNFTLLADTQVGGTVNGLELPQEAILVDDSNPQFDVVHYMINKEHILKFASELQTNGQTDNVMVFTLSSATGPMEKSTGDGNVKVQLELGAERIEPGNKIMFSMRFLDEKTNDMLNNVSYDFMLIHNGEHILHRASQVAENGMGVQEFTFEQAQQGSVTLRLEKINNTDQSVEFSINVVPEFPAGMMILLAGVFATMIIAKRGFRRNIKTF
jgi:hypothetical protein